MPEVSKSIVMPIGHGELALKKRYQLAQTIKASHYTQAIVLPNSFKSAFIPWFAGIPKRTGWRGEMRYGLLNDLRKLDEKRYPLMIERFMALGRVPLAPLPSPYPNPALMISSESQIRALKKCEISFSEKPILALCPGAEFGSAKRWPESHYAEVARQKRKEGWEVWLLGSSKDRDVTERIMQYSDQACVDLAGRTSLEEAIDLLSLATMVVSNDSGLMHIAAALQKPIVAIYGPTSASFTPPLGDKIDILSLTLPCQPCFKRTCPLEHHRCMRDLTPGLVLCAIEKGVKC